MKSIQAQQKYFLFVILVAFGLLGCLQKPHQIRSSMIHNSEEAPSQIHPDHPVENFHALVMELDELGFLVEKNAAGKVVVKRKLVGNAASAHLQAQFTVQDMKEVRAWMRSAELN